ncbi:MAG: T9SS type A sorting domain-containing protein [candidate division Zixibacteria bacterium]|nr:T9SS type A sorting domain-containing protein [candidate division Zixibacteria bacterium]
MLKTTAIIVYTVMLFAQACFAGSITPDSSKMSPGQDNSAAPFAAGYTEWDQCPGRTISDDVRKHYEQLNSRPSPVLLNTEEYFDWRFMGGVTAVKDQGDCGSCWDFAAVAACESAVKIADSVEWDLSEQQVIDCNASGYGCSGGWEEAAYELFINYGAIEEDCYPYSASDGHPCDQDTCVAMIKMEDYVYVQNDENAIKNEILNSPVVSGMTIHNDFNWYCYYGGGNGLDHAIVLVGWDDNECNGNGAWIVKNSLGMYWGDLGYFYLPYGSCGVGNYTNRPVYESRLPELVFAPGELSFVLEPGGIVSENLSISNTGTGDLYYRFRLFDIEQPPQPLVWLDIDNDCGRVIPSESGGVIFTCSAGDYPEGSYQGVVELYCNDPESVHVDIPVTMNITTGSGISNDEIPLQIAMSPNYPNPFNQSTIIQYSLPREEHVRIVIYDMLGRKIDLLTESRQSAGYHEVTWNASDNAVGIYFYQIRAGDFSDTKKMLLLK